MMRVYGKIPRHDHVVLPETFFTTGELHVTEKLDGSSFRFFLYEERFDGEYGSALDVFEPEDGSIYFGSRKKLRGTLDDSLDEIDGSFHRAVRHLRSRLDTNAIRTLHETYGPLVFFGENMLLHSIDYQYDTSPPPAVLGFDIYASRNDTRESPPADPFEETFEGYLPPKAVFGTTDSDGLFARIGVNTVPVVHTSIDAADFERNPETVPRSAYADKQAEGLVLRHLETGRRAKLVTPAFEELNRKAFGLRESEASNGNELFVAMFATNRRIRKIAQKMLIDDGETLSRSLIEPLRHRITDDIWQEDWDKIMQLDVMFNPSETKPLIARRCAALVTQMVTNAELNNVDPARLWENV
jgi:hypothetical protein